MDTDQIKQAQEAQQEWSKHIEVIAKTVTRDSMTDEEYRNGVPSGYDVYEAPDLETYKQLLSDYKASLEKTFSDHLKDVRKEFDALTGEEETALEEEIELSARIDTLKWVLELLNTCKPTNP